MIGSTKEFRKAQRYYGENLCGFSHPEYDYKKFVSFLLKIRWITFFQCHLSFISDF